MEQRFYINHRLQKAIDQIKNYPITIVSAPLAFGKRIAVEEAIKQAKEQGIHVEWLSVHQEENREYIHEVLDKLNQPIEGEWLYIFDGCNGEKWLEELHMLTWQQQWKKGIHCICIMSSEVSMNSIHLNHWIHTISKEDLELREKDIINLYQLHGIKISYQSAKMLYEYSGGWPGAVMLGIREYFYQKRLVPGFGVNELLEQEFFQRYSSLEREALCSIYGFKQLTLEQIKILIGIEEEESELLFSVIDNNSFIVYDMVKEVYSVKDVLFHYLNYRVQKMSPIVQKRIELRRAKWYESQREYEHSILIYQELGEYELIYQYPYKLSQLYHCTDNKFLERLWTIWNDSPYYLKCKYIRFSLLIAAIFFLWREKRKGILILEKVEEIILKLLELSEKQKAQLQGEIVVIRALNYDRDIIELKKRYKSAYRLIEGTSMIYDNEIIFTEGIPSILYRYYSKPGTLDQIVEESKTYMNDFYELTGYLGAGSEFMMQAEAKLLRGELDEARAIACRGIQLAEKYGQISIKIIGYMLICYTHLYLGEYKKAEEYLKIIEQETNDREQPQIQLQVELCYIQFHTYTGNISKIPNWIYHDHSMEAENSDLVNTYLNGCYLKQSLLRRQNQTIIEIAEYLYEQAYDAGFLCMAIEVKMIGSIAWHRIGNKKKSIEWIKHVLDLTALDGIYMPFMRYYMELLPLFEIVIHENGYQKTVQEIMDFYKKIEKIRKRVTIQNDIKENQYGLTKRELEIAILGARRYSNHEIANRLYISENTVKYNMKNIFQKLDIKSRLELKKYF